VRGRTVLLVLAMLGIVAASACAPPGTITAAPGPTAQREQHPPALPTGWRWESYGGVEVGVPGSWGWDNGSQRIRQWCVAAPKAEPDRTPAVGRPGVSTQVGCDAFPSKGKPDPETLLKNTGPVVAFDRPEKPKDGVTKQGDRTTVGLNGIDVIVQTEPALRKKIVATVHAVTVDVNGCPTTDPVSRDPARRPSPAVDVSKLRAVSAVAPASTPSDMMPTGRILGCKARYDSRAPRRPRQSVGSRPHPPKVVRTRRTAARPTTPTAKS
jgi:hypothetical protein